MWDKNLPPEAAQLRQSAITVASKLGSDDNVAYSNALIPYFDDNVLAPKLAQYKHQREVRETIYYGSEASEINERIITEQSWLETLKAALNLRTALGDDVQASLREIDAWQSWLREKQTKQSG